MTTEVQQQQCPFCRLFVGEELWETIENDFFGEEASIAGERSCFGCKVAAEKDEEGVLADLFRWRADHGGTELHQFFGSIVWVLDYALERLAEHLGSTVEMVAFVGEVREKGEKMVLVSSYSQDGFIVDIGQYSVWVEHVRELGWMGSTVINRDDYPLVKQEVQQ